MEETVTDGGVAIAISLDISNAFNSIPFERIMETLKARGFPEYIKDIIEDYLSDQVVEYPVIGDTVAQRIVRAGAPQGSVLGLLLWNLA